MKVESKNYQDVFKSLLARNTFLRYVPLHTILSQTTVSGSAVSDTSAGFGVVLKVQMHWALLFSLEFFTCFKAFIF